MLVIIILLIVLGLIFGSFVNALVWRVHEQSKLSTKTHKRDKTINLSVISGRSVCPDCHHLLGSRDLVPIFSWLSLNGKCRYCKKPISIQYPVVEAVTAAVFIASYIWWPKPLHGLQVALFVLWLAILIGFVSLSLYDLKWKLLPNLMIYQLAVVAASFAILTIIASNDHLKAIYDCVLALIIGGGIFYVLFQVSEGKWIGGGDVRLGAILGAIAATPGRSLLFIFIGSLIGSLISLPLMLSGQLKRSSTIPFGPLLIVGAVVTQLFGADILNWYSHLFIQF